MSKRKKTDNIEQPAIDPIVKIKVEALKYELARVLGIDEKDITILLETGITFKGRYNKSDMLSLLLNPNLEMSKPNNLIINSLDPSLYMTIKTITGLNYSGKLAMTEGDIEKLCFSTTREQNGYEMDVKHIICETKEVSKLIVSGKTNKFPCKIDLPKLMDNDNPSNTLQPAFIAKAIANYLQRKESYKESQEITKKIK